MAAGALTPPTLQFSLSIPPAMVASDCLSIAAVHRTPFLYLQPLLLPALAGSLSPSAAPLSRRFSLSVSLLPAHTVTDVQHAMPPSVAPTFISLRPSELPSLAGLSRPALLPSLACSLSLSPSFRRMPSPASSTPFRRPSHPTYWAQVIGWPPIRSFRKNSMAVNTPPDNEEKDCMYIKVSLDGAPYLRKVDLKTYGSYVELSTALEKMFSGFSIGQLGNHGAAGQDEFEQGRLADNLQRSEYVLTYEDKDGDWMLVGDVPWNMFMNSCQRLRIIKSSEAVGLGSGATEK